MFISVVFGSRQLCLVKGGTDSLSDRSLVFVDDPCNTENQAEREDCFERSRVGGEESSAAVATPHVIAKPKTQ